MFGIPLPETVSTPVVVPKTYGYVKVTFGAYSVNSPLGASGAWIKLVSAYNGGACLKYVEIPENQIYNFSGTIGAAGIPNSTCNTTGVSLFANDAGASSGGDINFPGGSSMTTGPANDTNIPPVSIGFAGITGVSIGGIEIIWNYGR